ncbi:unnamed protein product, partial [Polarella glacialis]
PIFQFQQTPPVSRTDSQTEKAHEIPSRARSLSPNSPNSPKSAGSFLTKRRPAASSHALGEKNQKRSLADQIRRPFQTDDAVESSPYASYELSNALRMGLAELNPDDDQGGFSPGIASAQFDPGLKSPGFKAFSNYLTNRVLANELRGSPSMVAARNRETTPTGKAPTPLGGASGKKVTTPSGRFPQALRPASPAMSPISVLTRKPPAPTGRAAKPDGESSRPMSTLSGLFRGNFLPSILPGE